MKSEQIQQRPVKKVEEEYQQPFPVEIEREIGQQVIELLDRIDQELA